MAAICGSSNSSPKGRISPRSMPPARALTQGENAKHPWMHRTKSVDYGIVLSGEIYLVLDDQELLMRAGDVCIQRGTNHAWSNRAETNCVMAFILIDGDPSQA